jgi:hypothetical protein
MVRFVHALLYVLAMTTAVSTEQRVVVIERSLGGFIAEFDQRAMQWHREGVSVIVDGECASSCTRYTLPRFQLDICSTPDADFQFHKPFNLLLGMIVQRDAGAVEASEAVWQEWTNYMTPDQQDWFKDRTVPSPAAGARTDDLLSTGDDAAIFAKPCPGVLSSLTKGKQVVIVRDVD